MQIEIKYTYSYSNSTYSAITLRPGYIIRWQDEYPFVITNYHPDYTDLLERDGRGNRRWTYQVRILTHQDAVGSKVLYADADTGIAVLSGRGIIVQGEPLELARPGSVRVGDTVAFYGYHSKIDFSSGPPLVRPHSGRYASRYSETEYSETGTVQQIGAFPDRCVNCIVLDATQKILVKMPAAPDTSGGPLVNAAGQVVGMVYAASPNSALAIHVSHLAAAARRAWLNSLPVD